MKRCKAKRNGTPFPESLRRRTAGFTLIELMISTTLTAMILVAASLCLHSAMISQRLVHARSDTTQTARAVLALISADLRAACPLAADYPFLGLRRTIDGADADNLDFATLNYAPRRPGESDICEISYFLRRNPETDTLSLWRRHDAVPDDEPLAGGTRQEIARNIRGLRFEYTDGLYWYDDWGDTESGEVDPDDLLAPANLFGMPEAVRITLMMDPEPSSRPAESRDSDTEPPLVFQTVVRLNLANTAWSHPNPQDGMPSILP